MTGQGHIDIVNRQNVVIVPTSAVRGTGTSPTVQFAKGSTEVTRPVVVGFTTGSDTEIVTGVQPGEVVVTGTNAPAQTATTTERFHRGSRTARDSTTGFGLGLSIVDAVSRVHGGTLTIAGGPSGGLDVVVEFPAAIDDREPQPTEQLLPLG
jgi:two-component system sensor histidine kinase VanS